MFIQKILTLHGSWRIIAVMNAVEDKVVQCCLTINWVNFWASMGSHVDNNFPWIGCTVISWTNIRVLTYSKGLHTCWKKLENYKLSLNVNDDPSQGFFLSSSHRNEVNKCMFLSFKFLKQCFSRFAFRSYWTYAIFWNKAISLLHKVF